MKAVISSIIVALVIVAILAGVVIYIVREKKKGTKCIGCPSGKSCDSSK